MNRSDEKIVCRTPTPGKGSTRFPKWKYEAVRAAILSTLREEGDVYFRDLPEKAGARLRPQDRTDLGSVAWHVTTVKLHMETIGEIKRSPEKGRQQLVRAR